MLLEDLLILTAVSGSLTTLHNIVGNYIYDIRRVTELRTIRQHSRRRQYSRRPAVTVIVPTLDNESTIAQCLSCLLASDYRKLEILVIDGGSIDQTKQLVKQFMSTGKAGKVKLYARRSNVSYSQSILSAKRRISGRLVAIIDPEFQVDRAAVTNAVNRFNSNPQLNMLSFNLQVRPSYNTLGLFERLEDLLRGRNLRVKSLYSNYYPERPAATIYLRSVLETGLKRQLTPQERKASYASNVMAYSLPVGAKELLGQRLQQKKMQLTSYQGHHVLMDSPHRLLATVLLLTTVATAITAVLAPIVLVYFIYLALSLREPALFVSSYLMVSIFIGFAVWGDDQMNLVQKLGYSLLLPLAYGYFLLMSMVLYAALIAGAITGLQKLSFRLRSAWLKKLADMQTA